TAIKKRLTSCIYICVLINFILHSSTIVGSKKSSLTSARREGSFVEQIGGFFMDPYYACVPLVATEKRLYILKIGEGQRALGPGIQQETQYSRKKHQYIQ